MDLIDAFRAQPIGHVRQTLVDSGKVILDQHNLVVDASMEVMLQALFGAAALRHVVFAFTGGRPVTPSLRSLPAVGIGNLNETPETKNFASRDNRGLATIGTFTSIFKPATGITYDTLGLTSTTLLLFAATSFEPVTLASGQAVATQWTILLRGK